MNDQSLAPVCLFVYNRLELTKQTVETLQNNFLASESELFVFSDGAKSENTAEKVKQVREYVKTITGFKSITILEAENNKGLANSIISGVTHVINKFGKVIVLEDDLVSSPNFLSYMNNALDYCESNDKVFSIAGYTPPIKAPQHDIYFTLRASSWGWATWKDRWDKIKWDIRDEYGSFVKDKDQQRRFNRMGSDMTKMFKEQMSGKINSWAIRWCYNQFLMQMYTVHPTISKINNIGTDEMSSNTRDRFNRFYTPLDSTNKTDFIFTDKIEPDQYYLNQFLKQYSITTRLKYKILNMFF